MNYEVHSFRNALTIFENDEEFKNLWDEIRSALDSISEQEIIREFNTSNRTSKKSISDAINKLIEQKLTGLGWRGQSPIFNSSIYRPTSRNHWWTLDFSKDNIAVEVAFNHGEAVAWNLIKPVLSSELNHVEKAIQTKAGIIITATDGMKKSGNFDGACGTYEKFLQYLAPLQNMLTVPLIIIGLKSPTSFYIDKDTKSVVDVPLGEDS